jgi:hypothetical protein
MTTTTKKNDKSSIVDDDDERLGQRQIRESGRGGGAPTTRLAGACPVSRFSKLVLIRTEHGTRRRRQQRRRTTFPSSTPSTPGLAQWPTRFGDDDGERTGHNDDNDNDNAPDDGVTR